MTDAQFTDLDIQDFADSINFGLILLDQNKSVLIWNEWIEKRSHVSKRDALGKHILFAFNESLNKEFIYNLNSVYDFGLPLILSDELHQRMLPLFESENKNHLIDHTISVRLIKRFSSDLLCLIQVSEADRSKKSKEIRSKSSQISLAFF